MKPILFKIGEMVFPSYTFLIMVGVLAAVVVAMRVSKRIGLPVVYTVDLAILGILFGFIGGRLGHILAEAPAYYLEAPIRVFYFWEGGFTSWGAHIGVLLSWFFYLRWRRQPIWAYFDMAAHCMFLAIFFGRTGCLLNGCCFGKPTDFFFSLTFHDPFSTAYHSFPDIPLHATQVYLMLNVLLIQLVIWWVAWKKWRFQGQLVALGLLLYPIGRFLIEFLRGDIDRGVYFDGLISTGQFLMVGYFLVAVLLYRYLKRKNFSVPGRVR